MITCKTFKGGYCEKVKVHVDRNYCENYCRHYPKDLKFPSGMRQAKNLIKAVIKRAKNMKNRSPEEIEKIKAICEPCDAYYEEGLTPRCTYCGCCLDIKIKWQSEDCPIDKWKGI